VPARDGHGVLFRVGMARLSGSQAHIFEGNRARDDQDCFGAGLSPLDALLSNPSPGD
jgi:hypothetical protein